MTARTFYISAGALVLSASAAILLIDRWKFQQSPEGIAAAERQQKAAEAQKFIRSIPDPPPRQPVNPRSLAYFQRMLIEFGDDARSSFSGDLAGLGLRGRDLQAMPVADAYEMALSATRRLTDTRTRRRMLLELFNATEE